MATKAELEAELLQLKKQLEERPSQKQELPEAENHETLLDSDPEEAPDDQMDWDQTVSDIMANLEDFPHKQPLLLALGAFAVGFLIGRSR